MHASIMHQSLACCGAAGNNEAIKPSTAVQSSPAPGYPVGVVASRLGVPTATLRSWSQRYGLGPDGHRRGRHRLYSETDIGVLAAMVEMVRSGVAPASAAESLRGRLHRYDVVSGPNASTELVAHAQRLDTSAMADLLDRSLRQLGVIATWNDVCRPAFDMIVKRQADGSCIDEEHALSWTLSGCFRQVVLRNATAEPARIVLACTPGEHHLLPLEALAAALVHAGTPVCMLGSDVPVPALHDALERMRPTAVVLWSHTAATADLNAREVGVTLAERAYVAGPGWAEVVPVEGVTVLTDIESACRALVESVQLSVV